MSYFLNLVYLLLFAVASPWLLYGAIKKGKYREAWGAKLFGAVPLTMIFAMTQMPLMKRYHLEPATLEASEAEAGDVSKG